MEHNERTALRDTAISPSGVGSLRNSSESSPAYIDTSLSVAGEGEGVIARANSKDSYDAASQSDYHSAGGGGEEITLEEAFHAIGLGWQQWRVLLVCGLCFCSDAIETGLLSFLQVYVRIEFDLSSTEEATLSSIVFAGELVGALIWGPVADVYGRWWSTLCSALMISIAGIASAFAPDFITLVALRALVGVGIGGLAVPFDVLAEFIPSEHRGKTLLGIEYFWTVGTIFVNGLAWVALKPLGWRWLAGLCAIPVVLAMISFWMLPESPHWLLTVGEHDKARKALLKAARLNGRPDAIPPTARIVLHRTEHEPKFRRVHAAKNKEVYEVDFDSSKSSGNPELAWQSDSNRDSGDAGAWSDDDADTRGLLPGTGQEVSATNSNKKAKGSFAALELFNARHRSATIPLWIVWTSFGFTYYGTVIVLPEFFTREGADETDFDYVSLFIASLAEFVACTIAMFLIDRVGRRPLSALTYMLCGVFTLMLGIDGLPEGLAVFFVVLARGSVFLASSVTWIVTPELYPTSVRAAGHSWSNGVARFGAFATPYWGDFKQLALTGRLGLYAAVNAVAAMASLFYPRETLGMSLSD